MPPSGIGLLVHQSVSEYLRAPASRVRPVIELVVAIRDGRMVSAVPSGLSSPRLSNQGPGCRIVTTFRNARAGSLVAAECASREEHVVNTGGIRAHHGPVCFDSFALDFDWRQLTGDGEALHVTPKAFDLLVLLVSHAPRVVSKDELQERLVERTFFSSPMRRSSASSRSCAASWTTSHATVGQRNSNG